MKLQSIVIGALAVVVVGQAATRCFEDRARRKEKIAAANALADASRTERFLRGQLQVATRYIHQGPIGRDRDTPRGTAVKVTVDVALEPDTARGAAPPQPVAFTGNALRFQSSWGNPDSIGLRITADVTIGPVAPIADTVPLADVFYTVAWAPARYTFDVSCEGPNARVVVAGPQWRDITIERGKMAEEVCHPTPSWQPFSLRVPSLPWAAGLVTGGVLLCRFVLCGRD